MTKSMGVRTGSCFACRAFSLLSQDKLEKVTKCPNGYDVEYFLSGELVPALRLIGNSCKKCFTWSELKKCLGVKKIAELIKKNKIKLHDKSLRELGVK